MIEGTIKLLLCVYLNDYNEEANREDLKFLKDKNGNLLPADALTLDKLKLFFRERIYTKKVRKILKDNNETDWIDWIESVQNKRNAIHAFKDKEIGTFDEFFSNLEKYLEFLRIINNALPYPDEDCKPREF